MQHCFFPNGIPWRVKNASLGVVGYLSRPVSVLHGCVIWLTLHNTSVRFAVLGLDTIVYFDRIRRTSRGG